MEWNDKLRNKYGEFSPQSNPLLFSVIFWGHWHPGILRVDEYQDADMDEHQLSGEVKIHKVQPGKNASYCWWKKSCTSW